MPWNSCRVDRATHWGNPFKIGMEVRQDDGEWVRIDSNEKAVAAFREMLTKPDRNYPTNDQIRRAFRGHNLACWCKPGQPCHADVLLELANAPARRDAVMDRG